MLGTLLLILIPFLLIAPLLSCCTSKEIQIRMLKLPAQVHTDSEYRHKKLIPNKTPKSALLSTYWLPLTSQFKQQNGPENTLGPAVGQLQAQQLELGSFQASLCLAWLSLSFPNIRLQMSTKLQTDNLLHRLRWTLGWGSQALLHPGARPHTAFRHPSHSSTFRSYSGILQYESPFDKILIFFPQIKWKQNSSKNYILAILKCFYHISNTVRYMCSDHLCISNIPEKHFQFFYLQHYYIHSSWQSNNLAHS